jgi:hypothetical protein
MMLGAKRAIHVSLRHLALPDPSAVIKPASYLLKPIDDHIFQIPSSTSVSLTTLPYTVPPALRAELGSGLERVPPGQVFPVCNQTIRAGFG